MYLKTVYAHYDITKRHLLINSLKIADLFFIYKVQICRSSIGFFSLPHSII